MPATITAFATSPDRGMVTVLRRLTATGSGLVAEHPNPAAYVATEFRIIYIMSNWMMGCSIH
ncbi:MAG: hypothetical protein ACXU8N_01405 [Telluria sp.]